MKSRNAFTLIELLVVIAIIAILAAILFPVFAQARAKARAITCISNEKQMGLAMMQYFQDYDERGPLVRDDQGVAGNRFTAKEFIWKDLVQPYVKNGGRAYNNGQAYTGNGPGGIFDCPDNYNDWANSPSWGTSNGNGDETTRYPRSYAVNADAGVNELGSNGNFWPASWYNQGAGALATLNAPSSTIMVGETRIVFPDTHSYYTGYEVNGDGQPWGGMPHSVIKGHPGGFTNFVFFDGHAKATKAVAAIQNDLWDCYGPNGYGTGNSYPGQQWELQQANGVPEWNPGL